MTITAIASLGTTAATSTVRVVPRAIGVVARVSSTRVGATATYRPSEASVEGTKAAVTSMITCPPAVTATSIAPLSPRATNAVFARVSRPAALTFDASGRTEPAGKAVTKLSALPATRVTVNTAAVAPSATPQLPATVTRIVAGSIRW